jgi:hypothetical protein
MKRTHGMSQTKSGLYRVWGNIVQRCTNPSNPRYADYGGRGITLCKRWHKFENFLADLGERPEEMTLDRIDNNKGYAPNNVRWVTKADNNRNSRRCVMVEINGEAKPINVWCREFGVPYVTFKQRRRNGWELVDAILTPPDPRRRRKTIHIKD